MIHSQLSKFLYYRRFKRNQRLFADFFERYQRLYIQQGQKDHRIETSLDALLIRGPCQSKSPELRADIDYLKSKLNRGWQGYAREIFLTLLLAAFILIFVRQMAFEHQEIPTGSMRPTFLEHDHVVVRKTAFGINNPFSSHPLALNSHLLQRGDIITLTSEGLSLANNDMLYFGLFPGKKRFVKRLVAKPADHVWFYAGKLWIAQEGSDKVIKSDQFMPVNREFIPFHNFFGHLRWSTQEDLEALLFNRKMMVAKKSSWNRWTPQSLTSGQQSLPWGVQNYGMVRLLTRDQLTYSSVEATGVEEQPYYLEIAHHPTVLPTVVTFRDSTSPFYVHRSLLPLSYEHIERLKDSLYTARFCVKESKAFKYSYDGAVSSEGVSLAGVENGIYEFESGKAYQIGSFAQRSLLDKNHALYSPQLLPTLFNCGLAWSPKLLSQKTSAPLMPHRYIYYDEGSLKLMGQHLMAPTDPLLISFIEREKHLNQLASFYPTFIDSGAPSREKILKEGLVLGPQEAMALGDNHADSGDSRDFGLIPIHNIQGTTAWRFWPLSSWQQGLAQRHCPLNLYDFLVWGAIFAIAYGWSLYISTRFNKAHTLWRLYKK